MANDDKLAAELQADSRKRSVRILAIMGLVLALAGIGVLALGLTWQEPAERLATRSVPHGAEYALIIGGAVLALAGLGLVVKSLRTAKR